MAEKRYKEIGMGEGRGEIEKRRDDGKLTGNLDCYDLETACVVRKERE